MSCPTHINRSVLSALTSPEPINMEHYKRAGTTSASSESGAICTPSGERPSHYSRLRPQPIEVIEAWSLPWHLSNVIKYVARAGRKGEEIRDLKKARWYLDRYIGLLEGRNEPPAPQE